IVYPGQNHGIARPSYQRDRMERYLAWYAKYLKPQAAVPAATSGGNRCRAVIFGAQIGTSSGGCMRSNLLLGSAAGRFAIGSTRGQTPATLSFEVASVKANASNDQRAPSMILPGGRFTATNNTVRALILNAYGIFATPYLLQDGPSWIDSARYDVDARAGSDVIPAGTTGAALWEKTRLMLRTLLADRFK